MDVSPLRYSLKLPIDSYRVESLDEILDQLELITHKTVDWARIQDFEQAPTLTVRDLLQKIIDYNQSKGRINDK